MAETGGRLLRSWLLLALEDLGGSARRPQVHERVESLFGASFTDADRSARAVRGQEPAWRNNLDSLYDRMKKAGDLETVARGGPWTLGESAKAELLALAPTASRNQQPADEVGLLEHFKPKDSSAYLAHLRGRVLIKSRSHETVLAEYGTAVVAHGWTPTTDVHPRDLELHRGDELCLAEIKVVYQGQATRAVREAVAQLLEYRHFHYPKDAVVAMLAVFSEAVGDAYIEYMATLGIASAWLSGTGWEGSRRARNLDLVP